MNTKTIGLIKTLNPNNNRRAKLRDRLFNDLQELSFEDVGVPDIEIRGSNKSYLGLYIVRIPCIVIYTGMEREFTYTYDELLDTALHEYVHHVQYERGFTRVRGVMHNKEFWEIYNSLLIKAVSQDYIKGVSLIEERNKNSRNAIKSLGQYCRRNYSFNNPVYPTFNSLSAIARDFISI